MNYRMLLLSGLATYTVLAADTALHNVDLNQAKTIASQVCAACHQSDGNSSISTNPVLAGQHAPYLLNQLLAYKKRDRDNPIMSVQTATLSEQAITSLAYYFSQQQPKAGAAKDANLAQVGKQLYHGGNSTRGTPACAACHNPNGVGIPIQFPRLAGQHATYTFNQLMAFKQGQRKNVMMQAIAATLSDDDMKAVAEYIAGLH